MAFKSNVKMQIVFSSPVMSSWINLKRMLGWRQRGAGETENESACIGFLQQLSLQPWDQFTAQHEDSGHGYVWHGAEQFPSEATDQECCSAHRATKMYEIALAEKQDFWVLSQKSFFFPSRWMFTSNWATVTLFISTWKWLLQLIIKGRIFIIPSWWNVFLMPEYSSLTGYLELVFFFFLPVVNWTTIHLHVLNMHFKSIYEKLHLVTFLKHVLESWSPWSLWNKNYLRHNLYLRGISQQGK